MAKVQGFDLRVYLDPKTLTSFGGLLIIVVSLISYVLKKVIPYDFLITGKVLK